METSSMHATGYIDHRTPEASIEPTTRLYHIQKVATGDYSNLP